MSALGGERVTFRPGRPRGDAMAKSLPAPEAVGERVAQLMRQVDRLRALNPESAVDAQRQFDELRELAHQFLEMGRLFVEMARVANQALEEMARRRSEGSEAERQD